MYLALKATDFLQLANRPPDDGLRGLLATAAPSAILGAAPIGISGGLVTAHVRTDGMHNQPGANTSRNFSRVRLSQVAGR